MVFTFLSHLWYKKIRSEIFFVQLLLKNYWPEILVVSQTLLLLVKILVVSQTQNNPYVQQVEHRFFFHDWHQNLFYSCKFELNLHLSNAWMLFCLVRMHMHSISFGEFHVYAERNLFAQSLLLSFCCHVNYNLTQWTYYFVFIAQKYLEYYLNHKFYP